MKKTKETADGAGSNMFVVHGPYEVPHVLIPEPNPRKVYKVAEGSELTKIWKAVGDHKKGASIATKDGIYIFAMRAARGHRPWYVGKAGSSLKKEVFTGDKVKDYNEVLAANERGTPVLFFITNESATRKHIRKEQLKRLEGDLILHAKRKNPGLKNKNLTTDPYAWHILGISGRQAKPSAAVNKFKTMMGCCTSCGA